MKKKGIALLLVMVVTMAFCISGCGKAEQESAGKSEAAAEKGTEVIQETEEDVTEAIAEEPEVDGSAYGYAGDDPVEAAVYKYMAEEKSKDYDAADAHIPTVNVVAVDYTPEDEVLVYGDFWIENYNIEGDTLKCASGGNYPGVMHVSKKDYSVTGFDQVADGEDFESSAKELFGENYDDFMKVYSDSDARNELRKITVSDYVNMNGLSVTQYQDEGWDPVKLYK